MGFWNLVIGVLSSEKRKNWFHWNCVVIGDDIIRVAERKENGVTAKYWKFEEIKFFIGLEIVTSTPPGIDVAERRKRGTSTNPYHSRPAVPED
ncbi:hypothetical protein FQA39_LY09815 [Lamprigera yunnana]|nr:hypothetical protein FQA39_LY09815 [Lamprigera yunnana]